MKTFIRLMLVGSVVLAGYSLVVFASMIGWWVLLVMALAIGARKGYQRLTAYGTARWAECSDLAGMLDAPTGLIIGRLDEKPRPIDALWGLFNPRLGSDAACRQFTRALFGGKPPLVRINPVHTAVFAPVGAGKTTGFVIPHLLTCPESCVVVDFKGELTKATANHRRRKFGHRCVILDPFKVVTKQPDSFNPLEFIDKDDPTALDECRDLAEALVIRTGQEKDPHWADSAEAWIAALTALVVREGKGESKSLQSVRTLLTDPQKMEAAIKLMCASDAWEGMLSRLGFQLTHYKDKELGSTLTTTNRFMRFLDTLAIAQSTKASSFDPAELLKGKMTVYLVLPPEHQRAQSPLLRLWIGSLLRAVVKGGLQEKNKVHFVIDEAASLGHMAAIDDALDKLRGYGVRLQLYYQSLGQLKKCWPEGQDQTLLGNVTQVFFGVNDIGENKGTADYISNRLGEETIVVESGGSSNGKSRQVSDGTNQSSTTYSWNENNNWQQHARKLLKPEEVLALPDRIAITFTPGVPPIWTRLVRYYERGFRVPGRFARFWAGVKMFAAAVIILIGAAALAAGVTAGVKDAQGSTWQVFR